jgi:hypothetical protein
VSGEFAACWAVPNIPRYLVLHSLHEKSRLEELHHSLTAGMPGGGLLVNMADDCLSFLRPSRGPTTNTAREGLSESSEVLV